MATDQFSTIVRKKSERRRPYGALQHLELRVNGVTARGGQDGSYRSEPSGNFDSLSSTLDTGFVTTGFNRGIYRFALEFNVSNIPLNSLVLEAKLQLSCHSPDLASHTVLAGFAGDGRVTLDDLTAGRDLQEFRMPETGEITLDVTSFVGEIVKDGSGWAGFNLRQDPLLDTGRCPATWHGPSLPTAPQLSILFKKPRTSLVYFCQRLVGLV